MSRAAKTDFAFDPTTPGAWKHLPVDSPEFRRKVRKFGTPVRSGPPPSLPHPWQPGWYLPISEIRGDGFARYDLSKAFQGVFGG
jgi:hypothetical protein